jgi:nucleoside-diphosphate-sugar epimerase
MYKMSASHVSLDESKSLARRVDFGKIAGKEILVTGASGMVGSFLTSALLNCCLIQGLTLPKITILARDARSSNLRQFGKLPNVKVVETPLCDWRLEKDYEFLVHAASPASPTMYGDAKSVLDANLGFLEKLQNQVMPETTLFVSSGEVYGANMPEKVEESRELGEIFDSPRSVYPRAKIQTELLLKEMGRAGFTRPLIARLFHSYGPGVREGDGRSFADFLWSGARGNDIGMLSSGHSTRTFLYLEDAVAGLITVLTQGASGETYNVGSETPVTILDFATSVSEIANVKVVYSSWPEGQEADYVHSPNTSIIPSSKKLSGLGWSQEVSLREGIIRSLNWIRNELEIKQQEGR